MTEILSGLLDVATLVFAVSSMLSVGFSYTVRELIEPLRNARLVIGALVANFVLVPLLVYAITGFLSLGEGGRSACSWWRRGRAVPDQADASRRR